jgi:hypothetical protein
MSKIMTVEEAIASMKAKEGANGNIILNRFNKKNFTTLMTAMANDPEFTAKVVKVKNNEIDTIEDVMVSKGFREFCKRIVEKAGVDKKESEIILTSEFSFTNSDLNGLYEFFAEAVYNYMAAGNQFDFLPKEDFKGSMSLKNVGEVTKTAEAFSPKDRSSLGTYKTTKKAHKELTVKSSCPVFLKNRVKVEK